MAENSHSVSDRDEVVGKKRQRLLIDSSPLQRRKRLDAYYSKGNLSDIYLPMI